MPHIIIEYSANLDADLHIARLVGELHRTALETGVFPIGGLRTRAERRDVYRIADGDVNHAFIAVLARIGQGRDAETRKRVAEQLMEALDKQTTHIYQQRGLGLTVEVQEIDGAASLKKNNLHERLAGR